MDDADAPRQETICPHCHEPAPEPDKLCSICKLEASADLEVARLAKKQATETYAKFGKVNPPQNTGFGYDA